MLQIIEENLVRQNRAMLLLSALLQEEFTRLTKRNPQGVSKIELSIQELLRQITVERHSLRRMIGKVEAGAERVSDLYPILDEEKVADFTKMLAMLDKTEQECAVQAYKNNELAFAMFEQSKSLLEFMHKEIQPKKRNVYGRNGQYAATPSQGPSFVSGRL